MFTNAFKESVIGLSVACATEKIHAVGGKLRVVRVNGVTQVVTRDLRSDRLNVEVEQDLVVRVKGIG